MQGLYLEDFEVGRVFEHPLRRTVTEMDNTLFSCLTHNPQPLHIDHEFSAKTEWGKPLVNSILTLGLIAALPIVAVCLDWSCISSELVAGFESEFSGAGGTSVGFAGVLSAAAVRLNPQK